MVCLGIAKRFLVGLACGCIATSWADTPSKVFPPIADDAGALRLVQVVDLARREQIKALGAHYQRLLASGIPDAELTDGSLLEGRVYCCGGTIESSSAPWVFVPGGLRVAVGDIIEVRMGRAPSTNDPGAINTAVRLRQSAAEAGSCRWVSVGRGPQLQILHCPWMAEEGWEERTGLYAAWLKRPPAAAGSLQRTSPRKLQIDVNPSLKEAVRRAMRQHESLRGAAFRDEANEAPDYVLVLAFQTQVDASEQIRNRAGASTGLVTGLLGAVFPWPCPTTYTLRGVLVEENGNEIASHTLRETEKRVGTMIWCPEVAEPGEDVVTRLSSEMFGKIAFDKLAPERTPAELAK